MGKYALSLLVTLIILPEAVLAADGKTTSYYCTKDAAGGVWYNDMRKKWEGSVFKAEGNFVLKMEFFRTYTKKDAFIDTEISEYSVSLTNAGSKFPHICSYDYFYAHTDNHAVPLINNRLTCNAGLVDYVFDLDSNRFLGAYLQGYTNGKDSNEDTPAISAGTCTKIN